MRCAASATECQRHKRHAYCGKSASSVQHNHRKNDTLSWLWPPELVCLERDDRDIGIGRLRRKVNRELSFGLAKG